MIGKYPISHTTKGLGNMKVTSSHINLWCPIIYIYITQQVVPMGVTPLHVCVLTHECSCTVASYNVIHICPI